MNSVQLELSNERVFCDRARNETFIETFSGVSIDQEINVTRKFAKYLWQLPRARNKVRRRVTSMSMSMSVGADS